MKSFKDKCGITHWITNRFDLNPAEVSNGFAAVTSTPYRRSKQGAPIGRVHSRELPSEQNGNK